jgi:hypothetical protein
MCCRCDGPAALFERDRFETREGILARLSCSRRVLLASTYVERSKRGASGVHERVHEEAEAKEER